MVELNHVTREKTIFKNNCPLEDPIKGDDQVMMALAEDFSHVVVLVTRITPKKDLNTIERHQLIKYQIVHGEKSLYSEGLLFDRKPTSREQPI